MSRTAVVLCAGRGERLRPLTADRPKCMMEIAGVPILGTSPASISMAEDRQEFAALLDQLDIPHPAYGITHSLEEGYRVAEQIVSLMEAPW